MEQEESSLLAVSAGRDSACVYGLVHYHAEIPVHAQNVDAKNILSALDGDIGHAQNFFGVFDALLAGNKLGWLPVRTRVSHFFSPYLFSCTKRRDGVSTLETKFSVPSFWFRILTGC